jgi:hypothetical protein
LAPVFSTGTGFPNCPKLDDASIKKTVVGELVVSYSVGNSVSYTHNFGYDHTQHLRRLAKFSAADSDTLTHHFSKLPRKVPAFLVTHFIKLICGALNSDGERRRKFTPDGSVLAGKCAENPFPCYLCNLGDVVIPWDSSRHIFGACSSVITAWDGILYSTNGPRDLSWGGIHW